jgi:hypothetical protein
VKPIYLKFTSEDEAMKVLDPYCHMDDSGKFLAGKDTEGYSVDIIGTMYAPAVVDGDTVTSPPAALDGFHVNMLVPDDFDELSMFEVFPVSPSRVFGGFSPEDLARD